MLSSAFASLHVIVPPGGYKPVSNNPIYGGGLGPNSPSLPPSDGKGKKNAAIPVQVGMAQTVNISDSFGTRPVNVLGTPLPVFHPGYMTTNISIEKATVDGYSFRNLGAFNPLWAHVGSTYRNENLISLSNAIDGDMDSQANPNMYAFMFLLSVRDKISGSTKYSYRSQLNGVNANPRSNSALTDTEGKVTDLSQSVVNKEIAITNPFGLYACVLSSARIGLSSQNLVVMDSIEVLARPIHGTWFTDAIAAAFTDENKNNGMGHLIQSVLFGYTV